MNNHNYVRNEKIFLKSGGCVLIKIAHSEVAEYMEIAGKNRLVKIINGGTSMNGNPIPMAQLINLEGAEVSAAMQLGEVGIYSSRGDIYGYESDMTLIPSSNKIVYDLQRCYSLDDWVSFWRCELKDDALLIAKDIIFKVEGSPSINKIRIVAVSVGDTKEYLKSSAGTLLEVITQIDRTSEQEAIAMSILGAVKGVA